MTVESRGIPRATLYVMFSACCFGSIPVLIIFATRSGARLVDLLAWRYIIAAAIFVVLSGGFGPLRRVGRRTGSSMVRAPATRWY